jgi:hypothetical protein
VFTLGSCFKVTKVANIFAKGTSLQGSGYALLLTKNRLGYILGQFFSQTHLVTLFDDFENCTE